MGISILSVLDIIGAVIAVIVLLFQSQVNLDKIEDKGFALSSYHMSKKLTHELSLPNACTNPIKIPGNARP